MICPKLSSTEGELVEKLLQNQPNPMHLQHQQQQQQHHTQQRLTPELHPNQQSLLMDYMQHGRTNTTAQFTCQSSLPIEVNSL